MFAGPALGNPEGHSMPKRARASASLSTMGLEGDVNRYRFERRDGDLDMALVLLTSDDLEHLRACGHDLGPGDIGENVLLAGIDPEMLGPGVRLGLGGVKVQVSRICDPCESLATLPQIGRQGLASLLRDSLGHRGWYARALTSGVIRLGDEACIVDRCPAGSR